MKLNEKKVQRIIQATAKRFRSYGGGRSSDNPFTDALKKEPASFFAGVKIEAVVRFVLTQKTPRNKK